MLALGRVREEKRRAGIISSLPVWGTDAQPLAWAGATNSIAFSSHDPHLSVARLDRLARPQTHARNCRRGIRGLQARFCTSLSRGITIARERLSALLVARKLRRLDTKLPPTTFAQRALPLHPFSSIYNNTSRSWCPNALCPSGRTRCSSPSSLRPVSAGAHRIHHFTRLTAPRRGDSHRETSLGTDQPRREAWRCGRGERDQERQHGHL
jgi:hypothetical protein